MPPAPRSPATRDLTTKQTALVDVIVAAAERGLELTREQAGELAGYGKGDVARVQASRTLLLPHVQEAMRERLRAMAVMEAPAALAMLRHIRAHGRETARLTAAMKLVDLAGVAPAEAQGAGSIAVAVVLPPELGALLTQARPIPAQVIEHEAEAEGERAPDEAGGGRSTPPRAPRGKAKAKRGRGRKTAATSQARPRRVISSLPANPDGTATDE